MRRIRMIGTFVATGLVVAACGGAGGKSASEMRPPTAVNLSVFVNDSKVSISPASVGAGPVIFVVTNQASHAEALAISRSGQNGALASTAPINPQGTTQVSVDVKPGNYTIGTAAHGSTDASLAAPSSIRAASFHIGEPRPNSNNDLLQP